MPPEPKSEVRSPISYAYEIGDVVDQLDQPRVGIAPRIRREQALGIGKQNEQPGAQQDRELSREEVVVTEGDLVGCGRVVLVDDRDAAPLEQPSQSALRVQVMHSHREVERRQQDLGRVHLTPREPRLVGAKQGALAHGGCRLKLVDRTRPPRHLHEAHAQCDRTGGDERDILAGVVEVGDLGADAVEHALAHQPFRVGDDGGAQLHNDGHDG
jgi:hypothetical protein